MFQFKFFPYDRGMTLSVTVGDHQFEMVAALRRHQPLYWVWWTRCDHCGEWVYGRHDSILCRDCAIDQCEHVWNWYCQDYDLAF
jgi:hypothetical protein